MTIDLFQTTEQPFVLVLGIGEGSKKYIDEIKGWQSPMVSAKMLDQDYTGPEAGIKVAILITTENVNATILAKNLKQSGLLTIIVTTCEIRVMEGSYDSMAMVSDNKVMETIKTVFEILTKPHKHIHLDFNDLSNALKESGSFQTFSYITSIKKGGLKDLANYLSEKLKEFSDFERLLVNLTLSTEVKELINLEDLSIISEFFSSIPESVQVLWGLDISKNLASDELAISIIATGISKFKE